MNIYDIPDFIAAYTRKKNIIIPHTLPINSPIFFAVDSSIIKPSKIEIINAIT